MDGPVDWKQVRHFNCHLLCGLCGGYLVDATTITECLHSFCRSCVVRHVEKCHTCPSCAVELSSSKPYSQLKRDHTLQTIVYKLVPNLARNELGRRREHRMMHALKGDVSSLTEDRFLECFFTPTDSISLSLNYIQPGKEVAFTRSIFNYRLRQKEKPEPEAKDTRYFLCPAALPIGLLMKFLINKYEVDTNVYHVEVLFNGQPLLAEYKLLDVAYIFSWKQKEPLKLWFRFVRNGSTETPADPQEELKETPPKRRRTSIPPPSAKRKRRLITTVRKKTLRAGRESHVTSPPDETTSTAIETVVPSTEGKIPADEEVPASVLEDADGIKSDVSGVEDKKTSTPDSIPAKAEDSVNIRTVRMRLNRMLKGAAEVPENDSTAGGSKADPQEPPEPEETSGTLKKDEEMAAESASKSDQNPQSPVLSDSGETRTAGEKSALPELGKDPFHPPENECGNILPENDDTVLKPAEDPHPQALPINNPTQDSASEKSEDVEKSADVCKIPDEQGVEKRDLAAEEPPEKKATQQSASGTPQPEGPASSNPLPDKSKSWLPKTVFDLDDSSLFALRLRRNLTADSNPQQKPEQQETIKAPSPPSKCGSKSAPKAKRGELILTIADSIFESKRLQMNDSLPQPALPSLSVAVHDPHIRNRNKPQRTDSIGALDLTRPVVASPLPAAKAPSSPCGSSPEAAGRTGSSPRISGPHPFFLSPGAAYNPISLTSSVSGILNAATTQKTDQDKMRDFLNFISLQKTSVKGKEIPPLKRLEFSPKPVTVTSMKAKEPVTFRKIRAPPGLLRIPQVVPHGMNGQDGLLVPSSSAVQNKR